MKKLSYFLPFALFALFIGCGGGSDDEGEGSRELSNNACPTLGLQTRIINGTPCSEATSPIVRVIVRFPNFTQGLCSGTLLTPNYVLTAAHCFFGTPRNTIVEVNGRTINARRAISHPNVSVDFDSQVVINDAAIVELEEPITGHQTLPILGSRSVNGGNIISIFGYGEDEFGNSGTFESGEMRVSEVNQTHVGARFNGEGSNPCFGDSGGPAILSFVNDDGVGINAVVGIVSSGELITCLAGDRTLFANTTTSSIFDWIIANVPGVSVQ